MKRNFITSLIVSLVMLIGCFAIPMSASASEEPTTIVSTEYFEDGSYIVTTLTLPNSKTRSSKPASKTTTYNENGTALWSYTLSATFTYDGNDSKCTSVSDSYTIYDSNWYKYSGSCGKDGNYASGTIVMKKKVLGVNVKTVTKSLNLSCDKYGNIV